MYSKTQIIGNLGQDVEIIHLDNGSKLAVMNVATSESWQDKSGQWQKDTQWHKVVAYGFLVQKCEHLKSGSAVFIEGVIKYRKHTDQAGVSRNYTDIKATKIIPHNKPERFENNVSSYQQYNQESQKLADEWVDPEASVGPNAQVQNNPNNDEDDLPF